MTSQTTQPHLAPVREERAIGDATTAWLYSDYAAEYQALRSEAAIFDHSGLGLLKISGEALPFLQTVLARDVEFLTPDRCLTSLLLADDGAAADIVCVYVFDEHVLLETAVGRGTQTRRALEAVAPEDVRIESLDDQLRVIGIEGPYAWGPVGKVFSTDLTALPYETVTELDWDGHRIIFARSGFTAEYGYKVMVPHQAAAQVWAALAAHAAPVGQQVLETAMLEVRQPVLHLESRGQDVLEAGLGWLVDPSKPEFVGRDALMQAFAERPATSTIGFSAAVGTDVAAGAGVYAGDVLIGQVTCAVVSPGLGGTLGLARVGRDFAAAGLHLHATTEAGPVPVTTLSSPYVIPSSWSTPVL